MERSHKVNYTIIESSSAIILMFSESPEYPRDTFAGKILITFQNQIPVSKFLSDFYRQKCRAAAEILGAWEGYELP